MGEKAMTVSALRRHLIDKATADSEFRNQLVAEPKAAIEAETGVTVPSEFNVEVHQETATTGHLLLPPPARLGEADLAQAAGGIDWSRVGQWEEGRTYEEVMNS